jgi:bacterioferritin
MVENDQEDELGAVKAYNDTIRLADEVRDKATSDLLTKILKMEEGHVDWGEVQRAQIEQMGLENYLATQSAGNEAE